MSTPREIEGSWWLPKKPEEVFFGTLLDDPTEGVTLTVKRPKTQSFFDVMQRAMHWEHLPVICGRDDGDKAVTLLYCAQTGNQSSQGMQRDTYGANFVLVGHHAERIEDVQFQRVLVDFTDFQAWLDLSCIQQTDAGKDGVTVHFKYPEDLVFLLADGTQLTLRANMNWTAGKAGESRFSVEERRLLQVAFTEPRELTKILEWLTRFRWLLSLLIGEPVELTTFSALLPHIEDPNAPQTTITTMGSHLRSRVQRRAVKPHRMLLPFKAVQAQFGEVVSRWFDYFDKVSAALDLYFAVRFSSALYLEHRFLFLAQALEVYHRLNFEGRVLPKADFRAKLDRIVAGVPADEVDWVREKLQYANEKTLAMRLEEIMALHPDEAKRIVGDPAKFSAQVRHTRNYYTHYNAEHRKAGKVADDRELVPLSERMQRLLEVCFLKDLGLDDPVHKIIKEPLPELIMFEDLAQKDKTQP